MQTPRARARYWNAIRAVGSVSNSRRLSGIAWPLRLSAPSTRDGADGEGGWAERGCILFSQYFDSARAVAERLSHDFPGLAVGLYAGGRKPQLPRHWQPPAFQGRFWNSGREFRQQLKLSLLSLFVKPIQNAEMPFKISPLPLIWNRNCNAAVIWHNAETAQGIRCNALGNNKLAAHWFKRNIMAVKKGVNVLCKEKNIVDVKAFAPGIVFAFSPTFDVARHKQIGFGNLRCHAFASKLCDEQLPQGILPFSLHRFSGSFRLRP